jgi:uncharacterized protein
LTRILLLSDTHNHFDPKIATYAESCDQIWHAGDIGTLAVADKLKKIKPLIAVYGNIDGMDIRKEFPEHQRFHCENVAVWITHIGGTGPAKYPALIQKALYTATPKLFICGHSHVLKIAFDKKFNMLYMNPGAAGNYGMHTVKTLLRFTIDKSDIKDLEVIEIGKI